MANKHGDFIWYELLTRDPDAAKAFYDAVVGWNIDTEPMAGMASGMDYRIINASEGKVGGVMRIGDEMAEHGARPVWLGYIAVDDVDQIVGAIEAAGGKTLMPANDIPDVGRIAMVADPQGAPFYVMKPKPPAGTEDTTSNAFAAERPMEGHCAWNELVTDDPEAAKTFYHGCFGWEKDGEMDMGAMGTYEFLRHGFMFGAVMKRPEQMSASLWTYYFRVPDIDKAVETIKASGGQVIMGPQDIPGGEFVINGIDPDGAPFALVGPRK